MSINIEQKIAKLNKALAEAKKIQDQNRSRALLLQDLITTDPVINKFPTHKVVDAYQQMLRIAPELSSEKEITRAYLRQAGASQALSPFEAGELLKANTALFKHVTDEYEHGHRMSVNNFYVDQNYKKFGLSIKARKTLEAEE